MDKNQVDNIVLVGSSTHIPRAQKSLSDFFSDKELNKSINPDEAVDIQTVVQTANLSEGRSKGNWQFLAGLSLGLWSLIYTIAAFHEEGSTGRNNLFLTALIPTATLCFSIWKL